MNYNYNRFKRITALFVSAIFIVSMIIPPQIVHAQTVLNLPQPGTMVSLSIDYFPVVIKGMTIFPDNPMQFDFIVDIGDDNLEGDVFKKEANKLIKYFMASLTVPEDEMWVNLSPYEEGRIIPDGFRNTEMGRDLLAQDYILKQLTASLLYPEEELGSSFWNRVYEKAQERYGTTEIPMNTFNKVWIVPERATVYVNETSVFVIDNYLKVMLEEDYLALDANKESVKHGLGNVKEEDLQKISSTSSEVLREIILPEIEKEVNEGKNFANLRQIYNSVILAKWYKENLKKSILGQVYVDKKATKGIDVDDKEIIQKIYNQYVEAFKKGTFDYIKEDYDTVTQEIVPRKYFSGGALLNPKIDSVSLSAQKVLNELGDSTRLRRVQNRNDLLIREQPKGSPFSVFKAIFKLGRATKTQISKHEDVDSEIRTIEPDISVLNKLGLLARPEGQGLNSPYELTEVAKKRADEILNILGLFPRVRSTEEEIGQIQMLLNGYTILITNKVEYQQMLEGENRGKRHLVSTKIDGKRKLIDVQIPKGIDLNGDVKFLNNRYSPNQVYNSLPDESPVVSEVKAAAKREGIAINDDTQIALFIGGPHVAQGYYYKLFEQVVRQKFGFDIVYLPFPIDTEESERVYQVNEELRNNSSLAGAVITRPWKEEFCEGDNDIGAINYIVRTREGRLIRTATDGQAWVNGLNRDLGVDYNFTEKNIVILGSGGAARELAEILNNKGVSKVTFTDVNQDSRESLQKMIVDLGVDYDVLIVDSDSPEVSERIRESDIVVNATGIGRGETKGRSPLNEQQSAAFHKGQIVLDLISNEDTQMLIEARDQGVEQAFYGYSMFIYGMVGFMRGYMEQYVSNVDMRIPSDDELFSSISDWLEDNAMLSSSTGGIDFNPDIFKLQTSGNVLEFDLKFDPQEIKNINIEGIFSTIINITPVTNLPTLIGVLKNETVEDLERF